MGEILNNDKYN